MDAVVSETDDPKAIDLTIEKETTKIKFIAFGKIKPSRGLKTPQEIVHIEEERRSVTTEANMNESQRELKLNELDEKMVVALKSMQREALNKEEERLTEVKTRKGKTAALFSLKENIVGWKKQTQEPTSVIDPETREVISDPQDIRAVVLKYCKTLLTNRPPAIGYEINIEIKRKLHEKRMEEIVTNYTAETTPETGAIKRIL